MLLTIATTHQPATDLGYLLHKNPARLQSVDVGFGRAQVVYPEASDDDCRVALVVDVDPVALVRRRGRDGGGARPLGRYVSDRPYAASSFLSVTLAKVFATAMSGRCDQRPELAASVIPLVARLPVVPCRGGEPMLRALFEPLGYEVRATPIVLDDRFPTWGDSPYLSIELTGTIRLKDLLEHLYVLLPVLDDDKHYWVGDDEVDKLLRRGGDWLSGHPARDTIARRYLRHDRRLTDDALARLLGDELDAVVDGAEVRVDTTPVTDADGLSLNEQRLAAVVDAIAASGAKRVLDLGCGAGALVGRLLRDTDATRVVGVDVSHRALETAARRLHLDTMTPRQRQRVDLLQGALTYRDRRLAGFDAAAVVEVIEHLDPPRLAAFERAVFVHTRPATVVLTTPNVEYNVRFPGLAGGGLRHRDHRFEWTRAELATWAQVVADRHGYVVEITGIGPEDDEVGCPTQMAVFRR